MRRIRVSGLLLPAVLLLLGGTAALAQLPGDLDGNGEVNLADLVEFVGCMNGPDGGSVDPTCDPGDFNPDPNIDLRDFAGFQARFGFGQGPPQIVTFTPTPGEWIVDDLGLTEVTVEFSEPVDVPREAIIVWPLSAGLGDTRINEFTLDYSADSYLLTITFDPPLRDDRVTLVLDYLIEDVSGRPLDGEILDPRSALLPSGDGLNGGQSVFQINVLQGDASRDGVVDKTDSSLVNDSLGLCDGDAGFNPYADLDNTGCVDQGDLNIVALSVGRNLPSGDGTRPRVTAVFADGRFGSFECLAFRVTDSLDVFKVTERACFLLDADENVIVPAFAGSGAFGDVIDFFFTPPFAHCDQFRINLSNAIFDLSGEPLDLMPPCTCLVDCPAQGGGP